MLGTQGDQARAELGAAQADIAKSKLLIAEADARAALANEKAEALRKENIAVWEAVSPRSVEFLNSVADLKKLAGTKYLVVSFSEYEMRFTAAQIRSVLKHAGWQRITDPSPELSKLPPGQIIGIDIEGSADMADAQPWEAATALASQLSKSGISASSMGSFRVNRDLPQNSIRVIVGMKPINTPLTALLAKPGLTVTGSTDGDDWEQ